MSSFVKQVAGAILAVSALINVATAEVRLPNVFSDHAVLQRGLPIHIWGWAAPGEKVTVNFHDQTRGAIADHIGAWQVWLMPEEAGGPYVMSVRGSESKAPIVHHDILVGDVWVASGQSNMEFRLEESSTAKLNDSKQEIANANHPRIRLLHVKRTDSDYPLNDVNGSWTICTPDTAADFSAVAYFFGREISERENVPVGLIESAWGGTPAQAWVSFGALGAADFSAALRDGEMVMDKESLVHQIQTNFDAQNEELKAEGKPPLKYKYIENDLHGANAPAVLFNGMIAPLTGYTIKGVIWYQGENDSGPQRAANYARLFPILISDWRNRWHEGDFPFLFVQISSFTAPNGDWGDVRDAQRRTLALRNTEMAVTLDIGNPNNVHPSNKQTVGARLALAALGGVYGQKLNFASPEFLEATTEGNAVRIWFTSAEGLNSRDKAVGGFEIAGEDHKFVLADAKLEQIDGTETVVVSASSILQPRFVRYGWSNVVTHYLYNSAGLPLGTFTAEIPR